jgi:hypothetical protein
MYVKYLSLPNFRTDISLRWNFYSQYAHLYPPAVLVFLSQHDNIDFLFIPKCCEVIDTFSQSLMGVLSTFN